MTVLTLQLQQIRNCWMRPLYLAPFIRKNSRSFRTSRMPLKKMTPPGKSEDGLNQERGQTSTAWERRVQTSEHMCQFFETLTVREGLIYPTAVDSKDRLCIPASLQDSYIIAGHNIGHLSKDYCSRLATTILFPLGL